MSDLNKIKNPNKIKRIQKLIDLINKYDDSYYNNDVSLISDTEYDKLYFELKKLEEETGYVLSSSPTQKVGFEIQSKLNKVTHDHLMLSLDKSKDIKDIIKFCKNNKSKNSLNFASVKCDGITGFLMYNEKGDFIRAETRGNGKVGEDITENVKQITNIPLHINNNGVPLRVEGEIIVKKDVFDKINSKLSDSEKFSKPRNYASGSVRQLDTKITKERQLSFIAWKNLSERTSFSSGLYKLEALGFEVVPVYILREINEGEINKVIRYLQTTASELGIPMDGVVFTYDDISYGEKLGYTGHHYKHSYAWKAQDDEYETTLRSINWEVGKTSQFVPVAIFDKVEIDNSEITNAALSNVSVIKQLKLGIGDKITVSLRNMIIPKIERNLTQSNTYKFPTHCHCGAPLKTVITDNAEFLYCTNPGCKFKKHAMFEQFVSKHGMDIKGISGETIWKFINKGWLNKFSDFYRLKDHKDEICSMDGFGEKSFNKMIESIEKSRYCTLSQFLVALSIPNIGRSAAETIQNYFKTSDDFFDVLSTFNPKEFDFTQLKDFGEVMDKSLKDWWSDKVSFKMCEGLLDGATIIFTSDNIKENEVKEINDFIKNKTFVITGKFSKPRSYYEDIIKSNGGKLTGSVSKKTDFLLLEGETGSTKYNKAIELNIPILSEQDFLKKMNSFEGANKNE